MLFVLGGDVMKVAARATQSIPIVFVSSADPVQLGFVASFARPGGNATGVTLLLDELASKRLELLKEAVPTASRVAFLWNPDHIDNELREAERAASSLGVTLLRLASHGPDDLDAILRVARDGRADAIYVVSSRQTVGGLGKVVGFAEGTDCRSRAAGEHGRRLAASCHTVRTSTTWCAAPRPTSTGS